VKPKEPFLFENNRAHDKKIRESHMNAVIKTKCVLELNPCALYYVLMSL